MAQWFIIGFLLFLPLLYELSSTFRYHAKFFFYYICIMLIAVVVLTYCWLRPKDVRNHCFIVWSMRQLMKLFGLECEIKGKEHLKSEEAYILVANHQSSLDCFGMFKIWPARCAVLIKKELMYAGPFGLAAILCGSVFIDRINTKSALDTMKATMKRVKEKRLKLWVFPEGTRNHEGGLMPFKKGAFHLAVQGQIPIVPCVFSSFSEFYSKQEKRFTPGKFTITVLPKISTVGLTSENVPELTERVRDQMLDVFNKTSYEATQNKLASKLSNGTNK